MNYLFFDPKWRRFIYHQKRVRDEAECSMDRYPTLSLMAIYPNIQSEYWEVGMEFIAFKCWNFYEHALSRIIPPAIHNDIASRNPVYHMRYIL